MANKQRGEVSVNLNGRDVSLRPSFAALCEIEERLKTSIPELIMDFQAGKLRVRSLATVVWAGMWAYDSKNTPSIEEVGEQILATGMMKLIEQQDEKGESKLARFLIGGIVGDEEDAKKSAGKKQEANP